MAKSSSKCKESSMIDGLNSEQIKRITVLKSLSENDAYNLICDARWGEYIQRCPKCGSEYVWVFKCRRLFKCNDCEMQFTAISHSTFHASKLTFRQIALLIFLFSCKASASSASRWAGISYKSVWVYFKKIQDEIENWESWDTDVLIGHGKPDVYIGYWQKGRQSQRRPA